MSDSKIIQIIPAPADLFAKFAVKAKSIDPSWTQNQDWFYEMEAGLNPGEESSLVFFLRVICLALMSDGEIAGVPFDTDGVFEPAHEKAHALGYAFKRSISLKPTEKLTPVDEFVTPTLNSDALIPLIQNILEWEKGKWSGTAEELHRVLVQRATNLSVIPKGPRAISAALNRLEGALQRCGITITRDRSATSRTLTLTAIKLTEEQVGPCALGAISFKLAPAHPLIEILHGHGVVYADKHGNEIAYGVLCDDFLISGSGGCAMEHVGTLRHDPGICRAGRDEAAK